MKKILYLVMASALAFSLCGCGENMESSESDGMQGNAATVSNVQKSEVNQESIISRNENKKISAPSDSISFEEACEIVDKCGMDELGIPQSAVNFKKYYFGTVDYKGKPYYSIYLYVEKDEKKVFVGNNILVSCEGGLALIKDFASLYGKLDTNGAENDVDYKERYPDVKAEPVEALKALAEKNLKMEYALSQYIFDVMKETQDINGMTCYAVVPQVEFMHSINMYRKLYITTDGTNKVFRFDDESQDFIELE